MTSFELQYGKTNVLSDVVLSLTQWEKLSKKQSVGVYFDNMVLYFECRINKNSSLSRQVREILPRDGILLVIYLQWKTD